MRLSVRNNGCMVGGGARCHFESGGADGGKGTQHSSLSSSRYGICTGETEVKRLCNCCEYSYYLTHSYIF